jgi:hypothetical protein
MVEGVASVRFVGVLFVAYPQDHTPRHVHGFVDETEVIVDLLTNRTVGLADRPDAIRPGNAKRSSVRRVLNIAAEHFDELVALWERMHV